MTVAEKLEQQLTGRPNSYVPARTLARLLDLESPDEQAAAFRTGPRVTDESQAPIASCSFLCKSWGRVRVTTS